jgi:immunity protein, SdpI family
VFGAATALVALTLGLGAWAYVQVPAGARIPIHWNAAGVADGFAGRWALFLVPAIAAAITLLLAVIPAIEPRRSNLLASGGLYYAAVICLDGLMVAVQVVTVSAALEGPGTVSVRLIPAAAGIVLVVLGIFMRNARSNFFVGIRTPWTLTSEVTWRKTHHLGAVTFVAAGSAIAVSGFLPPGLVTWWILGSVGLASLLPVVYSYIVWRSAPDRTPGGAFHRSA